MVATLGGDRRGLRDRALLLLGFAGAFRRSELVALDVADVALTERGLVVTVRRSKTERYAGHSLRAGLATSAAAVRAGVLLRQAVAGRGILAQCARGEPWAKVMAGPASLLAAAGYEQQADKQRSEQAPEPVQSAPNVPHLGSSPLSG